VPIETINALFQTITAVAVAYASWQLRSLRQQLGEVAQEARDR
jgi:hypothetical protein